MPAILFVCTANRIRSPLAEHLLRRRLGADPATATGWGVASAGAWAEADLPALDAAQTAATELGLDLSGHRTRRVEDLPLADYTLIVTMERGQREALSYEFPAVADRIITLAEIATGYAYDVTDPARHTLPAIRITAREIDALLTRALPRILSKAL